MTARYRTAVCATHGYLKGHIEGWNDGDGKPKDDFARERVRTVRDMIRLAIPWAPDADGSVNQQRVMSGMLGESNFEIAKEFEELVRPYTPEVGDWLAQASVLLTDYSKDLDPRVLEADREFVQDELIPVLSRIYHD